MLGGVLARFLLIEKCINLRPSIFFIASLSASKVSSSGRLIKALRPAETAHQSWRKTTSVWTGCSIQSARSIWSRHLRFDIAFSSRNRFKKPIARTTESCCSIAGHRESCQAGPENECKRLNKSKLLSSSQPKGKRGLARLPDWIYKFLWIYLYKSVRCTPRRKRLQVRKWGKPMAGCPILFYSKKLPSFLGPWYVDGRRVQAGKWTSSRDTFS